MNVAEAPSSSAILDKAFANDQITTIALGLSMLYKNLEMLASSAKPVKAKGAYARLDYEANMAALRERQTQAPFIRRRRLRALRFETEK